MSKDASAAFPIPGVTQNQSTGESTVHQPSEGGLTKRELFAAMVLQGLLSDTNDEPFYEADETPCQSLEAGVRRGAQIAVMYADALLTELAK